jgi:hypothetical protein
MRTEEHRPIRLQDYRPPDWLIETVRDATNVGGTPI